MKKHINIYIFIFFIIPKTNSFAQTIPHLNFWGRISLSQTLSEKWRAEAEFQHRRQNDYAQQKGDFLQENLLSSSRIWLHYQHKEDIGFSISPLAYYWHSPIIVSDSDKQKPKIQEFRFSLAVDLKHELFKKLWLIDRTCFEYRDFQVSSNPIIRLRNRLGLRYEFNAKWNITFFDELFLNITGVEKTNIFDHDRMTLLINYKPTNNIRLETGYMHVIKLPRNTNVLLYEHNFLAHLYFTLTYKSNPHHSKYQKHA